MIGRLRLNSKVHTKIDKKIYKKYYCSVCFALEERYGWLYKHLVSYDVTVAFMVLCTLDNIRGERVCRCSTPPFKKQKAVISNNYGFMMADITVLLVYYKALDDLEDENKLIGLLLSKLMKKKIEGIRRENPKLYETVEKGMAEQEQFERKNQKVTLQNSCKPFANMLSEIISFKIEDEIDRETMKQLFFWIGSWIYLVDACEDVYKDRKKGNYNPITAGAAEETGIIIEERRTEIADTLRNIQQNIFQLLALFPQTEETTILKKLFGNNATKKLARMIEV